jgi:hypothetical protein
MAKKLSASVSFESLDDFLCSNIAKNTQHPENTVASLNGDTNLQKSMCFI